MILPLLIEFHIVKPKLPSPLEQRCIRFLVHACATLWSFARVQFSSQILRHLDKATDGNFTSTVSLAFLIDISVQCVDLGFQNVIRQSNIRPSLSFNTTLNAPRNSFILRRLNLYVNNDRIMF